MQVAQQFPFPTLSALATNHHRVQRDYLSFPKTNENLYIFRAFFPRNFPLSTRLSYLVRGKEKRKHLSRRKIRSIEQFIGDPPLLEGKVEQEERDQVVQGKEKKLLFLKIHPWEFSNMAERCKKFYRKLDHFFFHWSNICVGRKSFRFEKRNLFVPFPGIISKVRSIGYRFRLSHLKLYLTWFYFE